MSRATSTEVYRAVAGVLDAAGIAHGIDHGGKHPVVVFDFGGRAHRVVFPASPSDWRAPMNARSFMRRLVGPVAVEKEKA